MMFDRPYSASEVAEIAVRATPAIDPLPGVVQFAAHISAASAIIDAAGTRGPLPPEFEMAVRALRGLSALFLLVCETGPVPNGRPS